MSYFAIITAGFGLASFFAPLMTPFLLLFRLIGLNYYIIRKDDEKTRTISKALQKTTMNTITLFQCGNYYPSGYFIGWQCAGFYHYSESFEGVSPEIHMITTPSHFTKISESEKTAISFSDAINKSDSSKSMTIYMRSGSYTSIWYWRMRIDVSDLVPKGQQSDIVDQICENFEKRRRGVFFIHGVSGAGKSTIGLLIANRLNGTLCHTFNPTEPGDTLQYLLRDSDPTNETPTIILIEEANTLIRNVHGDSIQKHKNITTCVHNKSTYNTFMDDLILYRNVLFILTSNESRESIDALDPCYLRKGRVHGHYSMMETLDI
jgi:hypothetical protein